MKSINRAEKALPNYWSRDGINDRPAPPNLNIKNQVSSPRADLQDRTHFFLSVFYFLPALFI